MSIMFSDFLLFLLVGIIKRCNAVESLINVYLKYRFCRDQQSIGIIFGLQTQL